MHKAVVEAGDIAIMPAELIEFTSQGRVLLIGSEQQTAAVMPHLEAMVLTTTTQKPAQLYGWLGAFTVQIDAQTIQVDCVLDMLMEPVLTLPVPPLGYFAPRDNAQALAEALQQIRELHGVFDKPRYFNYQPAVCAHSRRQITACTQCMDACPAEAIDSAGDEIKVNPYLCQGCGSCTAVCPSGAISYALPTLDVSINRLRTMMAAWFECETGSPQIVIHDLDKGQTLMAMAETLLPQTVIPFSIEEVGALGMPFYLTALAFGAANVMVWDTGSHPGHDWAELQTEIAKTNQLLSGLGYGESLISFCRTQQPAILAQQLAQTARMPVISRARYAGVDDKRRMITLAMTHLHQQAATEVSVLPLTQNAAFGEVKVDTQACTLCLSCVTVCPVGALVDGVDKPQLNFIEDRCVQCGLCATACPENAISLHPRYLLDRQQARKVRVLHEEPVFHCIRCQKPFATRKMIATMTAKLSRHPLFQGDALERLKMCEDCRVKDLF